MSKVVKITDKSFEAEVLKSSMPVLVDFFAEWCEPCKALAPVLDQLSEDMSAQIKIAKINIDESPEMATKYGVRAIPTMIILKDGEILDTKVSFLPKEALKSWILGNLG